MVNKSLSVPGNLFIDSSEREIRLLISLSEILASESEFLICSIKELFVTAIFFSIAV